MSATTFSFSSTRGERMSRNSKALPSAKLSTSMISGVSPASCSSTTWSSMRLRLTATSSTFISGWSPEGTATSSRRWQSSTTSSTSKGMYLSASNRMALCRSSLLISSIVT